MSGISSRISRLRPSALFLGLGLLVSACAAAVPAPSTRYPTSPSYREEKSAAVPTDPAPRTLASLRLTEQGRILIAEGRPGEAARVLEQAIHLDPGNGRNYFYFSEIWLLKKAYAQAQEFNRLAHLYLRDDPEWGAKIRRQRERIEAGGDI